MEGSLRHTMSRLACVALVFGAILPAVFSATQPALSGAVVNRDVTVVGGVITDYATDADRLYVAVGNRVLSYADDGTSIVETEVALTKDLRRIAIAGHNLVAYLDAAEIYFVDLETRNQYAIPSTLLPEGDSASRIGLCEDILAVGTVQGSTALIDLNGSSGPALIASIRWADVIPGDWMVTDLICDYGVFYAALFDAHRQPSMGAVVSIARDADGQWIGAMKALFEGEQQSQKLAVYLETAYVMTVTDVLMVNMQTGVSRHMAVAGESGVYPQAMTVASGNMYVLTYPDPLPEDRGMTLSVIDVSGAASDVIGSSVRVAYDAWYSAGVAADDSNVYLIGREDTAFYHVADQVIEEPATRLVVTVAITAAAYDADGQLLVARERGLCAIDLKKMTHTWCVETGLSAQKLLVEDRVVIGVGLRSGLFSMVLDADRTRVVDRLVPDDSTYSYIDATEADDGLVALVDANPLRGDKMQFHVNSVSVGSDGKLDIRNSSIVDIGPCPDASIAAKGRWVGVLCGERVLEYDRNGADLKLLTETLLSANGTSIHVDDRGLVSIGTSTGLVMYDLQTRQKKIVKPGQASSNMRIVAIETVDHCVVAIHGGISSSGRDVVDYCESGDVYEGMTIYRYERRRTLGAASIVPANDGMVIVSGSGTAVYLQTARTKNILYFPACTR